MLEIYFGDTSDWNKEYVWWLRGVRNGVSNLPLPCRV